MYVLKCLAAATESLEVNSLDAKRKQDWILFVREGEQVTEQATLRRYDAGQLKAGRDWQMRVDLGKREIGTTNLRQDLLLWSETQQVVYFVELTVPWEDAAEIAYERKKVRYTELAAEAEECGWKSMVHPLEVSSRGFAGRSVSSLLSDLGVRGRSLKQAVRNMANTAASSSE